MHNCREKFLEGVKTPLVSGQLVHMYYQDAVDPGQGKWYSGRVVKQQAYDHTRPASLWEGVEVSWEDGSECHNMHAVVMLSTFQNCHALAQYLLSLLIHAYIMCQLHLQSSHLQLQDSDYTRTSKM